MGTGLNDVRWTPLGGSLFRMYFVCKKGSKSAYGIFKIQVGLTPLLEVVETFQKQRLKG